MLDNGFDNIISNNIREILTQRLQNEYAREEGDLRENMNMEEEDDEGAEEEEEESYEGESRDSDNETEIWNAEVRIGEDEEEFERINEELKEEEKVESSENVLELCQGILQEIVQQVERGYLRNHQDCQIQEKQDDKEESKVEKLQDFLQTKEEPILQESLGTHETEVHHQSKYNFQVEPGSTFTQFQIENQSQILDEDRKNEDFNSE